MLMGRDDGSVPSLSPDGQSIVFTGVLGGKKGIFVRALSLGQAQRITGTDDGYYPFWSPDGRSIGYFLGGRLRRVDIGSGVVTDLAPAVNGRGGAWGKDLSLMSEPDFRSEIYR